METDQINHFSDEAKRSRFVRLATIRTNSVLDRLRVLGHCANKSAYSFDDKDVEKIFNEIEDEIKFIKTKFKSRSKRTITLE